MRGFLKKAASEAGLNDFLYFYILLYENNVQEAKRAADENKAAEADVSYLLTSYLRQSLSRAKSPKAKEQIQAKYGKFPEYAKALESLSESSGEDDALNME